MTQIDADADRKERLRFGEALVRLAYVAAFGCFVIVVFGVCAPHHVTTITVGLMAAGATLLAGGLLGFLFGVPHARDGEPAPLGTSKDGSDPTSAPPASKYRPNTSLEQISDWLTKILVGVGLVEIKSLRPVLSSMAAYIAKGLGNGEQANAFALALIIYFCVSGFIFGFLWARLYLPSWFRQADEEDVRFLSKKVSQLEQRQMSDAKAFSLISGWLNGEIDDLNDATKGIPEAIKQASQPVKAQIFSQVKDVSENKSASGYDNKLEIVIAVLRALIASDTSNRYHRNHSELSYALSRKSPPELAEAEKEMSEAIAIRDNMRKKGWKYYELRRARYRIQQDASFNRNLSSDPETADKIASDLRVASRDTEKWDGWQRRESDVVKWMAMNTVNIGPPLR